MILPIFTQGIYGRLRQQAGCDWEQYVAHPFLRQLAEGTLPERAFRRYLTQDYLFLIHFARSYALLVSKLRTLPEMRAAAASMNAILGELPLHVGYCAGWGLDEATMAAESEAPETVNYTRYVLDIGHSGDALDLLVALMPCVAGYAEIGLGLLDNPATRLTDNPYASWIRNYGDAGYLDGVTAAIDLLERVWQQRGAESRVARAERHLHHGHPSGSQLLADGTECRGGRSVTAPTIAVRELSLRFGSRVIFDKLSFDIPAGEWVSLLGASGAGKTSLLRIIAGLAAPTHGQVQASDGRPLAPRLAWMGQKDLLYPWLSVRDNVALGARLRGERVDRQRVATLLEQVGLSHCADDRPASLSGGMRQRAALARTLYEDRPIVLMDEPFSALDTLTRTRIQTLAAELLTQRTVVLITHDPMEACRLSHRLLVLSPPPGGIDDAHHLTGIPPRAPDDPALLKGQAALLQQLMRANG